MPARRVADSLAAKAMGGNVKARLVTPACSVFTRSARWMSDSANVPRLGALPQASSLISLRQTPNARCWTPSTGWQSGWLSVSLH